MKIITSEEILKNFKKHTIRGVDFSSDLEHIQTQISHIFLFPDFVYKFYKPDNEGFNSYFCDLSQPEQRLNFYQQDFFWNHYFNKNVYLELLGLQFNDNYLEILEDNTNCDDLIIRMKRINAEDNLTHLLLNQKINSKDAQKIGYEMTEKINQFPDIPQLELNYYEILKIRINDLRDFAYFAEPYIKKSETDKIIKEMFRFLETNKQKLFSLKYEDLVIAIDNHSDNIFYKHHKTSFIDIFPPKKEWCVLEPFSNIVRTATDALVLTDDEEIYKGFIHGFYKYYPNKNYDKRIELFYQIESAMIKGAYLYDLFNKGIQRKYEADKYWEFSKNIIAFLNN